MGGFVENCKNHNAIFSFRFILRNLKELGFGRKSEESVQVLVLVSDSILICDRRRPKLWWSTW